MRRGAILAGLAMPIALLAGCDDDPPVGATSTTADSAGIRIVTSTAPEWGSRAAWRVDTTPELVIGDAATLPSVLLVAVTAVRRLEDGTLVATLNDEKVVRWFDRSGAVRRDAGGPADFGSVVLVATVHDSALAWDAERDRATVVAPDGAVARRFSPTFADSVSPFALDLVEAFADGRLLMAGLRGAASSAPGGVSRDTLPLALATAEGRVDRIIARVASHENVIVTGPGFVTMLPRPFGARTSVAVTDGGVLVTSGDRDEVVRHAIDGGIEAIFRLDRPRRLISAVEVEQQRRRLADQVAQLPAPIGDAVAEAMAGVGVPVVYPAHDRMLVDATGAIWLREDIGPHRLRSEAQRWTILDRDGRWLGFVTTPPRLDVHQVTRDRVVGVWRDENDVEHLRVHRLSR